MDLLEVLERAVVITLPDEATPASPASTGSQGQPENPSRAAGAQFGDGQALRSPTWMEGRAKRYVRKFIGQRLRVIRKQKGLSQHGLGELSGLSGKFIGEVERGEKAVSIDSLHALAVALDVPLGHLADVPAARRAPQSEDAEKILVLLSEPHPPADIRRAYDVLRALFGRVS